MSRTGLYTQDAAECDYCITQTANGAVDFARTALLRHVQAAK
jgi:hypothetical protein